MLLKDIPLRDPFILVDKPTKTYYLYGSVKDRSKQTRFEVYTSQDLHNWEYGNVIFSANETFWGTGHFWAPEVHFINEKYHLFATFRGEGSPYHRCHILVSDTPNGVFVPLPEPITPEGWSSLDATYVEENGNKYTVFCHEWIQLGDGEMCLMQLSDDLSPISEPTTLFKASDAPWVINKRTNEPCYVTDGPWLVKLKDTWLMIWSSFSKNGYAVGCAKAQSLSGPWVQEEQPLLERDGGHAMIFQSFDHKTYLVSHTPNSVSEHPELTEIEILEDTIHLT